MKMNFPEETQNNRMNEQLRKGEAVTVVGASQRRGHLLVESNGERFYPRKQLDVFFMKIFYSRCNASCSISISGVGENNLQHFGFQSKDSTC